MLKCQLHTHANGDAIDHIPYSPKQLIRQAARLGYHVLAITAHRRVIFNKNLQRFARKNRILLISGIELDINRRHILVLNPNRDIKKVDSFEKLRLYKEKYPDCLIIAPHPFFPGPMSLKNKLIENIDLFDAIEYSYFYTKTKNYNNPAVALAKRWKKPLIATSDCHILDNLDLAHCLIDARLDTKAIFHAIRQNRIKNIHRPLGWLQAAQILLTMAWQNLLGTLLKR